MKKMSALRATEESHAFILSQALDDLARVGPNSDSYFSITRCYRRLAVSALLLRADADIFRDNLSKSGRALADVLSHIARGLKAEPKHYCSSRNEPFSDALAAGDLDAARAIFANAPSVHFPDAEYEDDFLRGDIVQRLFATPDDIIEINRRFARWEQVLEGNSSSFLGVLKALHDRDAATFEEAFDNLIEKRADVFVEYRKSSAYNDELDATEGKVFVEAFAILRIAELRGLPTRREYRFVPSIGRIPLGSPLPPADSWRSG